MHNNQTRAEALYNEAQDIFISAFKTAKTAEALLPKLEYHSKEYLELQVLKQLAEDDLVFATDKQLESLNIDAYYREASMLGINYR